MDHKREGSKEKFLREFASADLTFVLKVLNWFFDVSEAITRFLCAQAKPQMLDSVSREEKPNYLLLSTPPFGSNVVTGPMVLGPGV